MPSQQPDEPVRKAQQDDVLRAALQRLEQEACVPEFNSVLKHILREPSPLDAPRWTAMRSLRIAMSLAWAQVRIVPWLVVPVALVTATMAALSARFFGVSQDGAAAVSGFSSLMLIGIAITVTMALSTKEADSVTLATPIGPQAVVFARVFIVLVADALLGTAASALVAAWGVTDGLAATLAGWMTPLALIAGAVTFVTIWAAPWAGVIVGVILTPLVIPSGAAGVTFGLGAVTGSLAHALTPVGVVLVGGLLLLISVGSSRRAMLAGATRI